MPRKTKKKVVKSQKSRIINKHDVFILAIILILLLIFVLMKVSS